MFIFYSAKTSSQLFHQLLTEQETVSGLGITKRCPKQLYRVEGDFLDFWQNVSELLKSILLLLTRTCFDESRFTLTCVDSEVRLVQL